MFAAGSGEKSELTGFDGSNLPGLVHRETSTG